MTVPGALAGAGSPIILAGGAGRLSFKDDRQLGLHFIIIIIASSASSCGHVVSFDIAKLSEIIRICEFAAL